MQTASSTSDYLCVQFLNDIHVNIASQPIVTRIFKYTRKSIIDSLFLEI